MKKLISVLCLSVICIITLCPLCVCAVEPLDPNADASLTLFYQKENNAFPDLVIEIYRVAEALPDGTFELIEPYSSYPIKIHDIKIQEQWKNTATTLTSYIVANGLSPDRVGTTDETGTVVFEHLSTGLYLVNEVVAENNNGTYVFNRFMVYLPTPNSDGTFDYNVEAKPKCLSYVPKTEYKVSKLWQDTGYQNDRPAEVTVDIYKDGNLYEALTLNAENNWSYVWYVSENDRSKWTVVERNTPGTYTVTVQQNGGSFSIINTHTSNLDPPGSPDTGDSFIPLPWLLAVSISGIALLILGAYRRRA